MKTNYGLWNDRSEARRVTGLEITVCNLVRLGNEFDYDQLDAKARISCRLFERGGAHFAHGLEFSEHLIDNDRVLDVADRILKLRELAYSQSSLARKRVLFRQIVDEQSLDIQDAGFYALTSFCERRRSGT